jgi:hypothetical protein
MDAATLADFLTGAGLAIVQQFGDWNRSLLTGASPKIITIARKAYDIRRRSLGAGRAIEYH